MNGVKRQPFQCLSSNELKIIAVISMMIDHGAVVLIENRILGGPFYFISSDTSEYIAVWWRINSVLRFIGRLAFPIFCYQIVEGFFHTKNVNKYAERLLIFAIISEVPFDLAVFNTWFYPQYQNVYITLFFGLLAIAAIHKFESEGELWKEVLAIVLCCGCAEITKSDYGAYGVVFIILLYLFRRNIRLQTIVGCMALLWEVTAPLAFIPIRMYNGERGNKNWKWFFYIFYPAHLLILTGIRRLLP